MSTAAHIDTSAVCREASEAAKTARVAEVWRHFAAAGVCSVCCSEVGFHIVERESGNKAYSMNSDRIKACTNRGIRGRRGAGLSCGDAIKAAWKALPKAGTSPGNSKGDRP